MPTNSGDLKGYERDAVARYWLKVCSEQAVSPIGELSTRKFEDFLHENNLEVSVNGILYLYNKDIPFNMAKFRIPKGGD
jgi:hypothetical protein